MISFLKLFRFDNWWLSKASLASSVIYLLLIVNPGLHFSVIQLVGFFFWFFSVASLGHLVNSIFDDSTDSFSGKPAIVDSFHLQHYRKVVFLLVILVVVSVFFSRNILQSSILVGIHLLISHQYSAPPFRFKERGFWGVLICALAEVFLPSLIAVTFVFPLQIDVFSINPFLCFLLFLLVFGLRAILLHQFVDFLNDEKSGTATFSVQIGSDKLYQILKYYVIPVEFTLFAFFCFLMSNYFTIFIFLPLIYVLGFLLWFFFREKLQITLTRIWILYAQFYEAVLPFVLLMMAVFSSASYSWILWIHVLLFAIPLLTKIWCGLKGMFHL